MKIKQYIYIVLSITFFLLSSCSIYSKGNDTGVEYAPQMYHTIPYEPLTQITEEGIPSGFLEKYYYVPNSSPYNDYKGKKNMNSRLPVAHTIARQNYGSIRKDTFLTYSIPPDSVDLASKVLKNPLVVTDELLEEGKHLYINFCSPCHGAEGKGDGKVGAVYQGVANLTSRAYNTLTEGHIFHVITHGRNRMWPHKSLISPEDRWKIVSHVKKIQTGE